jgi:hypothetical protein
MIAFSPRPSSRDFQDPDAVVEAWVTEDRMLYGTYPFDEAGSREIAQQQLRPGDQHPQPAVECARLSGLADSWAVAGYCAAVLAIPPRSK